MRAYVRSRVRARASACVVGYRCIVLWNKRVVSITKHNYNDVDLSRFTEQSKAEQDIRSM